MKKVITILISILSILIIVFLYYYFIFIPSQAILKTKIEKEYISDMKMKAILFDNALSRYIQGTKSMSSRSMIRKKIVEFNEGTIDYNTLKTYTTPKYIDGIKALNNVITAIRYVNDSKLVVTGNSNFSEINFVVADTTKQELTIGFLINDSISVTYVISPITHTHIIVGYDIVYFNNKTILQEIANKNIDFNILYNFQEKLVSNYDEKLLYETDKISYQIKSKYSDAIFKFTISKEILFKDLQNFYKNQTIVFILLITGIILFLFVILQREKLIYLKKNEYLKELITKKNIKLTKLIDELKVKQTEILENEERYRNVADFTYDWEYWIDKNQNFIYISPSCERITGYTPKEFSQNRKLLFNIIHPDDIDIFKNHTHKITKKGEIKPIDFRIITKNNEIRWIEHVCRTVYDKNGENIGLRAGNRDITGRKKAEQTLKESEANLRESNKTKDKFFSIIAHDLRSPFTSMLGFSKMLDKKFDKYDTEKKKKFINIIYQGLQDTYKLLENLLYWSRSQRGTIDFNPEKINFHLLVEETSGLLRQSAVNKSIQLKNQIAENIYVDVDKDMLSTIIRNLISNAIKFTPKGGKISIEAKNKQQFIEITVKDNGIGIPKEIQSKLFDIGENTSTQGTENETGTGLGLMLCKEFTEKHGGEIWIESEIDKGSEFIFTIPVSSN